MNKKSTAKNTMSATMTAEYLAAALGRSAAHWATWLANDRKPGRVNRLLPTVPGPGRPSYAQVVVDAYVSDMLPKAPQPIKDQESGNVPKFGAHISAVTTDDGAEEPFVLVVSIKPLTSYKLSAQEARRVATRLNAAADSIDPLSGEAS